MIHSQLINILCLSTFIGVVSGVRYCAAPYQTVQCKTGNLCPDQSPCPPVVRSPPSCLSWGLYDTVGPLPTCKTFSPPNVNFPITACGYASNGTPVQLYGKATEDEDEYGLGLISDPTAGNEIWTGGFIQLDLNGLDPFNAPVNLQIVLDSVTNDEAWAIYGSTDAGKLGQALLMSGNSQLTPMKLPGLGIFRYLSIISIHGNLLINQIMADCPPSTLAPISGPSALPTMEPTSSTCRHLKFNFREVLGVTKRDYKYVDIYGSGQFLPVFGWSKYGVQMELFDTSNGLGVAKGPNNMITSDYYVQFYLTQYLSQVVIVNVIGDGIIRIYGSNLWGGVIGKYGQYLLYEGPPTTYRYERKGEFEYISVTAISGSCIIESVTIEVATTMFDMTDLLGETDTSYNYRASDGSGLILPVYGWTSLALQADLAGSGLGLGVFDTGIINGYQIGPRHYLQYDLSSYLGVYTKFDIIGTGEIQIYGSNLWGGVIGGYGQYLLYQGPTGSYTYTGYDKYRYISVHTVRGYAQVTKVWVGCPPVVVPKVPIPGCYHQWDFVDIIGDIDYNYPFLTNDYTGLKLTAYGWTSIGSPVYLMGTALGLGVKLALSAVNIKVTNGVTAGIPTNQYNNPGNGAKGINTGSNTTINKNGNLNADMGANAGINMTPKVGASAGANVGGDVNSGTTGLVSVGLGSDISIGEGGVEANIGAGLRIGSGIALGAGINVQIDTKHYVQFDFQPYFGQNININIVGTSVINIYATPFLGGAISILDKYLIYSGPSILYSYTGQYRYVSISAKIGSFLVQGVSVGTCAPSSQDMMKSTFDRNNYYVQYSKKIPRPAQLPYCNSHTWSFDRSLGPTVLYNKNYIVDDASGLTLPIYGWWSSAGGARLVSTNLGLGVVTLDDSWIDVNHYIQIDLNQYLGSLIDLDIIGTGSIAVYGSPLLGGVIGQFQQYLLYQGPPKLYTYSRLGEFRYISITAKAGRCMLKKVTVRITNRHYDLSDFSGETEPTHTYYATDNSGVGLTVYGWTSLALQTNLYANALGLGVSVTGSILGYPINVDSYLQFDLNNHLATYVKFNVIGNGLIKIYGSNLWGGVIGAYGQTLLYQGPAISFTYTGLGLYKYISITTSSGYAQVASVDVGC